MGVVGLALLSPTPGVAADIVTVRPSAATPGQALRVRVDEKLPAHARVRFGGLRVGAHRVRRRVLEVMVPPTLPVGQRVRMRVEIRGVPGRWTRGKRRLLVRPVPVPTSAAPPTPAASATPSTTPSPQTQDRRVLAAQDLTYLGAFAMPEEAGGWTTGWSSSGLAVRHVGGALRFFAGTHVYSGGLVYETSFPGVSKTPGVWPRASVTSQWCDIYGGRKRTGDDPQMLGDAIQTVGLLFDERDQRLYWSFGDIYNGDHSNDNVLGYTTFGAGAEAFGPWHTNGAVHSQKVRGGTLLIPQSFADEYLGGRRLGVGFGGYYSIIGEGSMGPTLFAIDSPGATELDPVALMDHPASLARSSQWSVRPANYWIDPDLFWGVGPVDGVGRWAPGDTINGAAVWIDEPDVHGLLVAGQLGTGRIWYANGGLHSDGDSPYWYLYDPADLAAVASGERSPESVQPKSMNAVSYPSAAPYAAGDWTTTQRIAGMAYDSATRTVFVLQLFAQPSGGDWTPVVHAYRVERS